MKKQSIPAQPLNKRVLLIWNSEDDTDVLDVYEEKYACSFSQLAEESLRGCVASILQIDVYEVPASLAHLEGYEISYDLCTYRTSATREEEIA